MSNDNSIVVDINLFTLYNPIYIYLNDEPQLIGSYILDKMPKEINKISEQYSINKVLLSGPRPIMNKMKEDIESEAIKNYAKNNLIITFI